MQKDIHITSGKGFKFITNFIIHETSEQKIILDFKYIPNKDMSLHHISLEVIKYLKKPSQKWEDVQPIKITLTTNKPHQSLIKLVDALKAQKDLYRSSKKDVVVLDREEANLFQQVGEENVEFVSKILKSFQTKEAKEILLTLNETDLNSLYISVKHAKNEKAVEELKSLIDDKVREAEFQEWVNRNVWVFGIEYVKKYSTKVIGIASKADFIVESLDGFTDLIELKKSDVALFVKDGNHNCYYPSPALSQVIGQAIHYMRVMEDHSNVLAKYRELDILKPRVKVVIGRSKNLNIEEKRTLRLLNSTLHGLEIITYDEIVRRADKILTVNEIEI